MSIYFKFEGKPTVIERKAEKQFVKISLRLKWNFPDAVIKSSLRQPSENLISPQTNVFAGPTPRQPAGII